MNQPRIFVSIANYRDSETAATIADLFERATHPQRVFVGALSQVVPGQDDDCLAPAHPQVRQLCVHAAQSLGACWARSRILTELRQDEDYVLQIDSHMRFVDGWDEVLLQMLARCDTPRALLSTYPLAYTPPRALAAPAIPVLTARKFSHKGILMPLARSLNMSVKPQRPLPNAFISAGFLFGPALAFDEVPYDPHLYFIGEEVSLAVRLWTHGWDVYSPDEIVLYHFYGKTEQRPRHWSDNKNWPELDSRSLERLRHLFGIETSTSEQALQALDRYGMGRSRSFAAYQAFADVDLVGQRIGPSGWSGHFPPHPSPERSGLQRAFVAQHEDLDGEGWESRGGAHSTLVATHALRRALPGLFVRLGVRRLLDAGCGDCNWVQDVSAHLDLYLGVDIVPGVVQQAQHLYGHRRGHFFTVADLCRDPLPQVDAVLCRNVLEQLPLEEAVRALRNLADSGARWLLASTRNGVVNAETEPATACARDLCAAPFGLPAPYHLLSDNGPTKLGLWPLASVRQVLAHGAASSAQLPDLKPTTHAPVAAVSDVPVTSTAEGPLPSPPKVFVQVACRRESEIAPTLANAWSRADNPERLAFGVNMDDDVAVDLEAALRELGVSMRPNQLRLIRVHAQDSQGLGFGRSTAQRLWAGEAFVLQIDGHMRFAPGWDTALCDCLAHPGARHAVISTYLPGYEPPDKLQDTGASHSRMRVTGLGGAQSPQRVHLGGWLVPPSPGPRALARSPFVVCNFLFARAEVFAKVPTDPWLRFYGDEITYSARLWTHGYDVLQPDQVLAYHQWETQAARGVQAKQRSARSARDRARVDHLLGLAHSDDPLALRELDRYGLGSARSLASFWAFAGVDLVQGRLEPFAQRGQWGMTRLAE